MMLLSFVLCLVLFIAVGLLAARRSQNTEEDYYAASRSVGPWLTALSAVSSQYSGFMFLGLIGAVYTQGLWFVAWWSIFVLGVFVVWIFFFGKIRETTEEAGLFDVHRFIGGSSGAASTVTAIIIFLFLSTYAAAQFMAGAKALDAILQIPLWLGLLLSAFLVAIYSFSGGIRASIWTDAAQSLVMFGAMSGLCAITLNEAGGILELGARLRAIDPALVEVNAFESSRALYLGSSMIAGIGLIGQPHVVSRIIAMRRPEDMPRARAFSLALIVFFSVVCCLVGLCGRVLLPPEASADPELTAIVLAQSRFSSIGVGLFVAGIFAAVVSTADSQLLACSAVVRNILPSVRGIAPAKFAMLLVCAMALVAAWLSLSVRSIFTMVYFSWSAMASAFGPLMILRALRKPIPSRAPLPMLLGGLITALIWRFVFGLSNTANDALLGMSVGFLVYAVTRFLSNKKDR